MKRHSASGCDSGDLPGGITLSSNMRAQSWYTSGIPWGSKKERKTRNRDVPHYRRSRDVKSTSHEM